jgi:hypothetical protein
MGKGQTIAIVILAIALVGVTFYLLAGLGECYFLVEDYEDLLEECDDMFWEMSDLTGECTDRLDWCLTELDGGGG